MRTDQFWKNCVSPEVDFELNSGKTVFLEFSQKEAVFGKTNYSPFSFSLGPIYKENMSEIDFSTCATKSRYWSKFVGSRS